MRAGTYPLPGTRRAAGWHEPPGWPLFAGLGPVGALVTAPRLARTFCGMVVTGWGLGSLAADCELIASELCTNVVAAATGPDGQPRYDAATGRLPMLWLRLMSDGAVSRGAVSRGTASGGTASGGALVRLEVWDDLPAELGAPAQRRATAYDESGRGLELVDALSADWGWERLPNGTTDNTTHNAKRVWALLRPGGKDQP
jgi:hypothetical protein